MQMGNNIKKALELIFCKFHQSLAFGVSEINAITQTDRQTDRQTDGRSDSRTWQD